MSFAITTSIINKNINWPDNKKFAFTIFDDTDGSNLNDNRLVYDYLVEKKGYFLDKFNSRAITH